MGEPVNIGVVPGKLDRDPPAGQLARRGARAGAATASFPKSSSRRASYMTSYRTARSSCLVLTGHRILPRFAPGWNHGLAAPV